MTADVWTAARGFRRADTADQTPTIADQPGAAEFGRAFSGRMGMATWTAEGGWSPARVVELADLIISPAAMVFHYGQAIFEGMKAYRAPDGRVLLFRPDANATRFARSAARLSMPEPPVELFVDLVSSLVREVADDVPAEENHSLYLRPMMFATEPCLGTRPSREYVFLVLASPSGPYFPPGAGQSIDLWASLDSPRAFPGGTGFAKCAGNYAATMLEHGKAVAEGFDQTLWLDGQEHRYVEELGGMNLMIVRQSPGGIALHTPPLSDTILAGITRDSILRIARTVLGIDVREAQIDWRDWRSWCDAGQVTEAFACGTAAVVTPIRRVRVGNVSWLTGGNEPGPVATALKAALVGIQTGRKEDPFGWTVLAD
jgi:branched-chain amino acid aminotransferase